eukprot:scaffold53878_cov36-Prasinocladus_malaysianus.AAC.1
MSRISQAEETVESLHTIQYPSADPKEACLRLISVWHEFRTRSTSLSRAPGCTSVCTRSTRSSRRKSRACRGSWQTTT